MNILVTGAGGQLGKEIKKRVNSLADTKNNYIFATRNELDITDDKKIAKFITDNNIKIIVNCAAYTNVNAAQDKKNQDTAFEINAVAPMTMARECRKHNTTLIHVSTDYVFNPSWKNNQPLKALRASTINGAQARHNFYGYSKLEGERAIENSGCKYIIIRTSWVYSVEGENFVKKMFNRSMEGSQSSVVVDQVGAPTSATDLASFIVGIIENDMYKKCGTYNYSAEGTASWYDIARAVYEYAGKNPELVLPAYDGDFDSAVWRPGYSVFYLRPTKETFGWQIPYWRDSVRKVVEELRGRYYASILEAQNDEYNYGHNVDHKKKDEE